MGDFRIISCCFVIVLTNACGGSDRAGQFPGLEDSINEYYWLESKGDWGEIYEIRKRNSLRDVRKEHFIEVMEEGNRGWETMGWKILRVDEESDGLVSVYIRFEEVPPDTGEWRAFLGTSDKTPIHIERHTLWENVGASWVCTRCGPRMRLSFN